MNRRTFLRAAGLAGIVGASGCATPLDSLVGPGDSGSGGATNRSDGTSATDGSDGAGGPSSTPTGSTDESTDATDTSTTPEAPPTRSGTALTGVFPGGPDFAANLVPYTEWLSQPPAVALLFVDALGPTEKKRRFVEGVLTNVWKAGCVPMISWQPFTDRRDRTPETIERMIATGEYDDQLAEWALLLESWARPQGGRTRGRRFYIRPAHEMNGNWFPWSPVDASQIDATVTPAPGGSGNANETLAGEGRAAGTPANYIVMWRRLHDMFGKTDLDETDVQWVWAVNTTQVPADNRTERYYPGDEYVDWVGIDGFNFGATQSYSTWKTPAEVFDPMLGRLRDLTDKPVALTEFASTSFVNATADGNDGNDNASGDDGDATDGEFRPARKAEWIEAAFEYVKANDIKMACWFNVDKTGDDEADWAVFGGKRGTSRATVSGEEYPAYETYKRAVTGEEFLSARTDYPSLLTDGEFAGEF